MLFLRSVANQLHALQQRRRQTYQGEPDGSYRGWTAPFQCTRLSIDQIYACRPWSTHCNPLLLRSYRSFLLNFHRESDLLSTTHAQFHYYLITQLFYYKSLGMSHYRLSSLGTAHEGSTHLCYSTPHYNFTQITYTFSNKVKVQCSLRGFRDQRSLKSQRRVFYQP